MRTFEEIDKDIREALRIDDVSAMHSLAEEIQVHGTPQAAAVASHALGAAEAYTGSYPGALEHYRRALALHDEMGDRAGVARVTANMGNVYRATGDNQMAMEHYRRALEVLEELDYRSGVAIIIGNMGNVHHAIGDFPAAMGHFRRALALHEELGDRVSVARVTGNMGNVYLGAGDYPLAMECFRRALAVHEELGYSVGIALVTGNMGNVYQRTGDYPSALEHFRRALALHEELGDRVGLARTTGNVGMVYGDTGDHRSALEYFSRALAIYEEQGDRAGAALMAGNVISALMKLDRYDEAAELLERQAAMQMDDPGVRTHHLNNSAAIAAHKGDLDAAHAYLLQALSIAKDAGLRGSFALNHAALRDLAQQRNDFAGFIEHNAEYLRITEEIRGKETTQRLTMMEAERRMEGERREREKERALLYGALPKSVADRMIRGEDVSGDHFDQAAVMFLDIVGFTSHTSTMPPSDVVKMLENIFRTIDTLCDAHDVVKVKTIGDSYMCFRGDADAATNAHSVASVALDVMNHTFTWHDGTPVQFRIGMHIGPATAGVIGTQRLQYDVWGDTVNVASRMESSGQAGRGHISAAFAAEIESRIKNQEPDHESGIKNAIENREYRMSERGMVDVKGKGMMMTYWLEKR